MQRISRLLAAALLAALVAFMPQFTRQAAAQATCPTTNVVAVSVTVDQPVELEIPNCTKVVFGVKTGNYELVISGIEPSSLAAAVDVRSTDVFSYTLGGSSVTMANTFDPANSMPIHLGSPLDIAANTPLFLELLKDSNIEIWGEGQNAVNIVLVLKKVAAAPQPTAAATTPTVVVRQIEEKDYELDAGEVISPTTKLGEEDILTFEIIKGTGSVSMTLDGDFTLNKGTDHYTHRELPLVSNGSAPTFVIHGRAMIAKIAAAKGDITVRVKIYRAPASSAGPQASAPDPDKDGLPDSAGEDSIWLVIYAICALALAIGVPLSIAALRQNRRRRLT